MEDGYLRVVLQTAVALLVRENSLAAWVRLVENVGGPFSPGDKAHRCWWAPPPHAPDGLRVPSQP